MIIPAKLLEPTFGFWRQAARDILLSSVAATIAWWLAGALLGHHQPVFAAIAALVCLSPGVASHGRQAVGMIAGVALGIAAGLIGLRFSGVDVALRIAAVTLVAMFAAVSFGLNAVMVIQAAGSAIIVVGTGTASAGTARLEDAAVGGLLGLLFSQVLFTPDPVFGIRQAAVAFLEAVRDLLADLADPDASRDVRGLHDRLDSVQIRNATLRNAIDSARAIERRTLRGLVSHQRIDAMVARFDEPSRELGTSAILLGQWTLQARRCVVDDAPSAAWLRASAARCARAARALRNEADGSHRADEPVFDGDRRRDDHAAGAARSGSADEPGASALLLSSVDEALGRIAADADGGSVRVARSVASPSGDVR